ncbi:ribosomal protein S18 acetylase RimI-like enzyme [Hoyosella altamirensis]|uniref:Ribosomal protein S18 acetylase RimI-like enzyme n=2 Tax=Hoyosella altamirensis TaxID=616997 RepID=A0A839RSH7_9ACTN|nr:ribosomal protein S18 acetylase RimI-like enzyme [Hoyosella altamirensis]
MSTVIELSPETLRERMHEALQIYVAAMGYPPSVARRRAPMWAEHALRPGWKAVAAVLEPGDQLRGVSKLKLAAHHAPLVGIAYGYSGAPSQWWYKQVWDALESGDGELNAERTLEDYFELTELHVHPDAQGMGVGQALITALLDARPERAVLLSTPEVGDEDNRAWRLYRRLGFADVLRHFQFDGDPRPFAVLGRELPL